MLTKLKWLFKLFFAPNSLKEDIIKQAVIDENKPKGEGRWEHVRNREAGRLDQLGASIKHSLIFILSIAATSLTLVFLITLFADTDETTIRIIRAVSITIVAWAVIFRLGYINPSWSNNSLPEQLQTFVFKFFYFAGVTGIIVSIFI